MGNPIISLTFQNIPANEGSRLTVLPLNVFDQPFGDIVNALAISSKENYYHLKPKSESEN